MKNNPDPTHAADLAPKLPYSYANVRSVMGQYVIGRLLAGIAGIVLVVSLARNMGVDDYSRFATIAGLTSIVGILSSLGIEKAVTCFVPQGRIQQRSEALARFIWRMIGLRLAVLTLMTVTLVTILSTVSPDPAHLAGLSTLIAVLIICLNLFQFVSLILQSLVQQKILAWVLAIQWGGRLALLGLILLAVDQVKLMSALYVMVIPDAAGSVVLMMTLRQHLRQLHKIDAQTGPAPVAAWPAWRDVRKIMRHNYGYSWLITPPQGNSMIVIAAVFLSVPQVAAYGFFVSMVERIRAYLPLQFMLNMAEPVLIAGYARDRNFQELCRRSNALYKPNLVFLMLFLTIASAVAPLLTRLLTGGKYVEYALFLPLLIAQVTLGSRNTILQIIANSVGRSEILSKSGTAALVCMTIAAGVCLHVGAPLLLLTTPLVFETVNTAVTVFLLRRFGFHYDWQAAFHLKTALSAAAAFAVTHGIQDYVAGGAFLQVVAAGLTATLVFGVAGKLLGIVNAEEILAVQRLLRPRRPSNK